MVFLLACEDSEPHKAKKISAAKQINAVAFKKPSGEIKTVQIEWGKNKSLIVSDAFFADTATASINIRTKSGYEFSSLILKEILMFL